MVLLKLRTFALVLLSTIALSLPASAATIFFGEGVNVNLPQAADNDVNTLVASGDLALDLDGILEFIVTPDPFALSNEGGVLDAYFDVAFSASNLTGVSFAFFSEDAFGRNFINASSIISEAFFGPDGILVPFDFAGTGASTLVLQVFSFTSDGFPVDGSALWSLRADYAGDIVNTASPIPLPAGAWLLLTGLGAMALVRRHRRSSA